MLFRKWAYKKISRGLSALSPPNHPAFKWHLQDPGRRTLAQHVQGPGGFNPQAWQKEGSEKDTCSNTWPRFTRLPNRPLGNHLTMCEWGTARGCHSGSRLGCGGVVQDRVSWLRTDSAWDCGFVISSLRTMVFDFSQLKSRNRNHGTRGMRSGKNYTRGLGLSPSEPDIYTFISKSQVCVWCMGIRYRRPQRQHMWPGRVGPSVSHFLPPVNEQAHWWQNRPHPLRLGWSRDSQHFGGWEFPTLKSKNHLQLTGTANELEILVFLQKFSLST